MPTDATITYRTATIDDVETLAGLRWAMETERHAEIPTTPENRAAYIASWDAIGASIANGSSIGFLAESDGEVVASALLLWWIMPPTFAEPRRGRGYVSSVYTKPEYRRRGIGRQIMTNLMEYAREKNMTRLLLNASEMGRPLYLDLGFKPTPFETLQWDRNPKPPQQ